MQNCLQNEWTLDVSCFFLLKLWGTCKSQNGNNNNLVVIQLLKTNLDCSSGHFENGFILSKYVS